MASSYMTSEIYVHDILNERVSVETLNNRYKYICTKFMRFCTHCQLFLT